MSDQSRRELDLSLRTGGNFICDDAVGNPPVVAPRTQENADKMPCGKLKYRKVGGLGNFQTVHLALIEIEK